MMTELQREIVQDLIYQEGDMASTFATSSVWPTSGSVQPLPNSITWPAVSGSSYPCIASITSFTRELDTGGFRKVQLLSATLRRLNCDGTVQFPSLPTAQETILYSVDGLLYRITSVKLDPTSSHFRLIAEGPARGI